MFVQYQYQFNGKGKYKSLNNSVVKSRSNNRISRKYTVRGVYNSQKSLACTIWNNMIYLKIRQQSLILEVSLGFDQAYLEFQNVTALSWPFSSSITTWKQLSYRWTLFSRKKTALILKIPKCTYDRVLEALLLGVLERQVERQEWGKLRHWSLICIRDEVREAKKAMNWYSGNANVSWPYSLTSSS